MAAAGSSRPGLRSVLRPGFGIGRPGHRGGPNGAPNGDPGGGNPNNGSIVLLLSLFLLLLVFFIVLNAQSVQTTRRVRAVMSSLERSFTAFVIDPRLRERTDPVASRAGTVFAVQRLDGVGELFATAVAVAKVETVTPGRLLEVRLPVDELFVPGTTEIRPDRQGLIDRVASSLLETRPGERIELDALLAIGPTGTPSQPPGPVARAGALARYLIADGAPAESVTVGIERGDPGSARLLFSIRAAGEKPASEKSGDKPMIPPAEKRLQPGERS